MALCCRGVGNSGADLRARFECELFEVAVNVAKRDSKDRDHHSSFQSGVYVAFGSRGRRTSIRTAVESPARVSNPIPVNPTIRRSAAARCIVVGEHRVAIREPIDPGPDRSRASDPGPVPLSAAGARAEAEKAIADEVNVGGRGKRACRKLWRACRKVFLTGVRAA